MGSSRAGESVLALWRERLHWLGFTGFAPTQAATEATVPVQDEILAHQGGIVRLSDMFAMQAYCHNDYLSSTALGEIGAAIETCMINRIVGWRGERLDRKEVYHTLAKSRMLIQ
ncbi:MAG: hypothetical protein NZM04_05355 [Methylacidiphilales bacterium]|nr:hypothetical protein [Candidatus Methylacidiphilales bacterium]